MCGIAGAAWTADAEPLDHAVLRRMTSALIHRGPDDEGFYHSSGGAEQNSQFSHSSPAFPGFEPAPSNAGPGAALGQRRLSIIDLGGGHQPLSNEDGTVWITFNGEIYNYRELQSSLERQGHRFQTASDTETIVHLYEQYGPACVAHLRGMFAFAIWDQNRRLLFLARDRLGKKPLVYRLEDRRLLFASELKALLQVPGVPRELNPQALDEYLTYQYVPHPHSILKGFSKLPPAHWAVYQGGRLTIERYWRADYSGNQTGEASPEQNGTALTSPGEYRRKLRETLTEAVRLRMRSDVPLGAFLSGGIDSTIIAGLMQELSDRPVKTFSIGFPIKEFDERSYAREAATHLRTEHYEAVVDPQALAMLPKLIWHYDEPFADSSAIPTMYLSEMTRKHVTVALSGDGGDELFAGYKRYYAVSLAAYADHLPRFVRNWLSSPIWQRLPARVSQNSSRRKLKRLLGAIADEPKRRYLKWVSVFDEGQRRDLYTANFRESLHGADAGDFLMSAYRECPERDFVTQTTCADVHSYLPCDILTKVDIASMAYSLECRCPFLDHHVTDFAARLPLELKLQGRKGKRILIETFSDLLPPSIQHRSKMGFGVPLGHWFRDELRPLLQDVLLDRSTLDRGLFRPESVRRLVDEHIRGQWDHSVRLWSLLCFELWQRMFLEPAIPPSAPPVSAMTVAPVSQI